MTKLTVILALVLIIVIGIGAYEWGKSQQAVKNWKEREAIDKQRIADKDAALAAQASELTTIKNDLATVTREISGLKADSAKAKASLADREKELRDLPPEHLVTEARTLLNTDGITLSADGEHVSFTVSAFTEAVVRITRERKLTLEYIPKLEATIAKQDFKITTLEAGMAKLEVSVNKTWPEKYQILQDAFNDFKKVKERSWLARIMDTGGKIAVGIVAGFVLAIAK